MGVVYEVLDTKLDRRAALKVLRAEFARDRQVTARFLQEAKAASKVVHPGVVHIYEFGQTEDGIFYFVMEYLDGETFSARLERAAAASGRLGLPLLVTILQVAKALAAVHKLGFVHRDLKPGNIMIVPDSDVAGGERAKVLDFGIVKAVQGNLPVPGVTEIKTQVGALMGTPQYMAPEQWRGQKNIDGKVDVYALGVMAFTALAGRLPFTAEAMPALGMQHCFEAPPPLAAFHPALSPELLALVAGMLEKEPTARLTMAEVAERLGQILPLAHPARSAAPVAPQPATMPEPLPSIGPRSFAISTAPTLEPVKKRSALMLTFVLLALGGVILAGFLSRQYGMRHFATDMTTIQDLVAPTDLSTATELSAVTDLSTVRGLGTNNDFATATVATTRTRCVPRRVDGNCITSRSLSAQQREALQAALKESGLQLCPGDRLVIRGLPSRPTLSDIPLSADKDAQALLLLALKGLKVTGGFPAELQIRCGGR